MNWVDALGIGAAVLTTLSFVPQAWLIIRSGDTRGISVAMYACFTLGIAMWLGYGLLLRAWPIVAANAITLALSVTILLLTLRGRRRG